MQGQFVEWYLPETEFMVAIVHIVPAEQRDIHALLDCWCSPEYGKNEQGVKTVIHKSGVQLEGSRAGN